MSILLRPLLLRVLMVMAFMGAMSTREVGAAEIELTGFLSFGVHNIPYLQRCEGSTLSRQSLRVVDETAHKALTVGTSLVREMAEGGGTRKIYVEFLGTLSAPQQVVAKRFRSALGLVQSCAEAAKDPLRNARLEASGNMPTWRLLVTKNQAELRLLGEKTVRFAPSAFNKGQQIDDNLVFDAWSPQDGGTIRLELSEQMCSDGQSETAFGVKALLRYGSRTFEGCASRP